MLLRIFTKLVIINTDLGADDWTIIATVVSGIPSSVLNIHGLTASKHLPVFYTAHSSIRLSFTLPLLFVSVILASRGSRTCCPTICSEEMADSEW